MLRLWLKSHLVFSMILPKESNKTNYQGHSNRSAFGLSNCAMGTCNFLQLFA